MIENTRIEEIINRCYGTWKEMLGIAEPYDRGRESDGTFKADDPSTPDVNEAWKSGKSPVLRRTVKKKTTRKKVTKKND